MSRLNALVIGNSDYEFSNNLPNPANDAEDISEVLIKGGFTVNKLINATLREMKTAIKELEKASNDGGEISLFFFAGHGAEVNGKNYLIAKDTSADDEADVEHGALGLNEVLTRMEPKGNDTRTSIIILDACRNNPFIRKWRGVPRDLAPVYAPKGTLIAYATSPGQFADDGSGRNGSYTEALLKHIETPDVPIEAMFKRVRNTLAATTRQKQTSWEHTSLSGEFYFNLSVAARISSYSSSAIKDSDFILDETKWSHRTIAALKVSNWYTQNPAINDISPEKINKAGSDSLFVLGRNILQAADGSSNMACEFINTFKDKTKGVKADKIKSLLDGIVFEIFFNSDGELRESFKNSFFNVVFSLEKFAIYKDSFDFISSILLPYSYKFFAVPGKNQSVTADVTLDEKLLVTEVHINGRNRLKANSDFNAFNDRLDEDEIKEEISKKAMIPSRLLNIVYNKSLPKGTEVELPYRCTITND